METLTSLNDISDGNLYDINDYVAADAGGCEGCSACCHDVGDLVVLTPYDHYEIMKATHTCFHDLLGHKIVLREENKIKLPYLRMLGTDKSCSFLDTTFRCSIHEHRPNICRLFPLGRVYENNNFKYFLQVHSCLKPQLYEVQIKDWLGIDHYEENKSFLLAWHQFLKALAFRLKFVRDAKELQAVNDYLKETFYNLEVASIPNFYAYFEQILPEAKEHLGIL